MVRVRHLCVRLIRVDVVPCVWMKLADAVLPHPRRTRSDPEVDEVLAYAGPFDEPDVVAEVIADGEQRILGVDEIVVPGCGSLARELAARHARRERLREEAVQAEGAYEAEIRVDAGHLVPVVGRTPRLTREKDRADVRVAEDVAAAAEDGVVVSGTFALGLG